MDVVTTADIGAQVRERRAGQGLTQSEVAERADVGRKFVTRLEQGHPNLEVGRVLAVLEALGLVLTVGEPARPTHEPPSASVLASVFEALEDEDLDHR